jgi:hypothetical protein
MIPETTLRVFVSWCLRVHLASLPIFVPIFLSVTTTPAIAQTTKSTSTREQFWVAYFNQTRFSKDFGAWLDVQYRQTDNFVARPFQFLFRPALTWYASDRLRLNAGYAYIHHFPAQGSETSVPEHRAWQQVWFQQNQNRLSMLQWLRLEERFIRNMENDELAEGYNRRYRLRYNLGMLLPFKGGKMAAGVPFATFSNEVFFNLGSSTIYNTFDQNRFFAGIGYSLTDQVNVQFGYLNVYQQLSSGNEYIVNHALRVAVFHNMDFRE